MRREWMTIIEHQEIAKQTYRLVLEGEMVCDVSEPGQFVHIQISKDYYLRRPVSISDIDMENKTMTLLYKVMGKGTDAMTEKKVAEKVDVLGPGGQGFPINKINTKQALLVGGGIGVPPLYYLAKQLEKDGVQVTSILGFQSAEEAFLVDEFESIGDVYVTTNDGTLGHQGLVTDLFPHVKGRFDTYFTCGPTVMLKAVASELSDVPGYISMEERMGCGIGACFACVVPSNDEKGYRRICCDGPVFDAKEVVLS
ncbi:dihydroorotate dehydrogenase electron transfer subunit [Halobacillus mangrovi]|uniref:dihydroorotate dehydrogenase electron transfer subunit n=1 Tax=Halobacillus mangrovi TaxID=402384 RepID=UPI003D95BD95